LSKDICNNVHISCYVYIHIYITGLEWFNVSEDLSLIQDLKGKIVLLDFFTYCCINCMHVLAELEEIEKKISIDDGFVVVSMTSLLPKRRNYKILIR
jgi:thiol-disulfide isomerase/thioredoxin